MTKIFKYWDQKKDNLSSWEQLKIAGKLLLVEKISKNIRLIHTGYDMLWFVFKNDDGKEYRYQVGWGDILEVFQCLINFEETEKAVKPFIRALIPAIDYIVQQIENDNDK